MSPTSSFMTLMVAGLWHWLAIAFALGYLLGSIPFGLLLTRFTGVGDIRAIGSGNIGATNVLRTGHRGLAAATLLLDGLKGTAAVLIVDHFYGQAPALLAGLGAFLGHLFPVWLKFRGGKGVATYLGVMLGLMWQAAGIFVVVWLLTAAITRFSSLGALLASLIVPVAIFALGRPEIAGLAAVMTLFILFTHRANIRRLLSGEESKIGAKA